MEAIINSTFLVAIAEIGDKTQLLSFLLAAKFKKPLPIILGIFVATLLNHFLAAYVGELSFNFFSHTVQKWLLVAMFAGFGLWMLIPDKDEGLKTHGHHGAFVTTLVTFFLAEMGDKTQLATVALGAQYKEALWVTLGTTLGMMLANVPAVLLGHKILKYVSLKLIHRIACALFILTAVYIAIKF